MPKTQSSTSQESSGNVLAILLASLILTLLVVPLLEGRAENRILLKAGISIVYVVALYLNRGRLPVLVSGSVLGALAIPIMWITVFVDSPVLFAANCFLSAVFFVMIAVVILAAIVRERLTESSSISGSICAYLLLGLAWALAYWGLERIDEGSIVSAHLRTIEIVEGGNKIVAFTQLVYYSFVTMSTLGYGDLTPRTPIAETLSWMQSVTGQFYFAVLVARLVNALPSPVRQS